MPFRLWIKFSTAVVAVVSVVAVSMARAAVTLDGALGPSGPLAGPDYVIPDSVGQTRGANLFHSFGQFNLLSSESATFTGAASIQNIIGRVTGGSSSIDGTVRSSIAGANVYLINPAGIMFGPNARLDVSGSFHASTADYLWLADGGVFHASNPATSNLTVAPPAAFGFLTTLPAAISVQGSQLAVPIGQTLSLIGGAIDVAGRGTFGGNATLKAEGGRINLVAVASPGELAHLTSELSTESFSALGNITLSNAAFVTVAGNPGGVLAIRGGRFVMDFASTTSGNNAAIDHPGVGTDIRVRGEMLVKESEIASTSFGAGRAGHILISADSLRIEGGPPRSGFSGGVFANIGSRARGTGRGGDVGITARSVSIDDRGSINNNSLGAGQAGDIRIRTSDLSISGESYGSAYIANLAAGTGNAGNIYIDADSVRLTGGTPRFTGITTQAIPSSQSSPASGGTLRINTETLEVRNGAQISASLFSGSGNAGRVEVNANAISISGTNSGGAPAGIFTGVEGTAASGSGGSVSINTGDLTVTRGGLIMSRTVGTASSRAGDISIVADNVYLQGSAPNSIVGITGVATYSGVSGGGAGNIGIDAKDVKVLNGAQINSNTYGAATGGAINIRADHLLVAGEDVASNQRSAITAASEVYSTFGQYATGRGGNVDIDAKEVAVADRGLITVKSETSGDGGNLNISADRLTLSNHGSISATSTASGRAGNINIVLADILRMRDSDITTQATQSDGGNIAIVAKSRLQMDSSLISASVGGGNGDGGNISIDPDFVILNHSRIAADAFGGSGGNVNIAANHFIASPDSTVTASSTFSFQGSVVISAPNEDVGNQVGRLPETSLDAAAHFRSRCAAVGSRFSSFTVPSPTRASAAGTALPSDYGHIADAESNRAARGVAQSQGDREPLVISRLSSCRP